MISLMPIIGYLKFYTECQFKKDVKSGCFCWKLPCTNKIYKTDHLLCISTHPGYHWNPISTSKNGTFFVKGFVYHWLCLIRLLHSPFFFSFQYIWFGLGSVLPLVNRLVITQKFIWSIWRFLKILGRLCDFLLTMKFVYKQACHIFRTSIDTLCYLTVCQTVMIFNF